MNADSVTELRQHTLRGGQRDTLVSLFEREFVVSLKEAGCFMRGTFRDLVDPKRFVRFRGFANMESRRQASETFYDGFVWRTHGEAANSTMIDSDNELLLKPVTSGTMDVPNEQSEHGASGHCSACLCYMNGGSTDEFSTFFRTAVRARLAELGVAPKMELQTETAQNTFLRLPVREREQVFAWIGSLSGVEEFRSFQDRWTAQAGWMDSAAGSRDACAEAQTGDPAALPDCGLAGEAAHGY